MNNNDSFTLSAIKPTQITVVTYAIIKQIFVTFFVEGDYWKYRLLISIIWLSIIFIVTNSKKLTKRQVAILILATTVIQEIVFFVAFGGDRMIFFFLLGCSLMSIMYADKLVMLTTMFLSCIAISFCIFVLGIKSTVGVEYELVYDVFNIAGLIMINTVIYLIGKYTIGTLAKAQKEAEDANKAKSDFLARMSHEIRTPMNAIIGIAQIQMQKDNNTNEYTSALEKIHQSGNSLLGIINDILDLSKIETGKMELYPINYNLPALIHDTVQLNRVQISSKPIEFILDIDEKLPSGLTGDELRIKQILNNLLSNAIKYTEKGYIKLSVSHSVQKEELLLHFIVEDTGQGMKPESVEQLFSEYIRFNVETNRTTEGTGIGLNITRSLVELMEGAIKAESKYGVGSTFTVTVKQEAPEYEPIGHEIAEQLRTFTFSTEKQHANVSIVRESMPYGKVLIVDDVETNLYVAEGLLSPYCLQIETAISGFAAIEKVESGRTYDVIFMDHMMPHMDGIETTQKLHNMGYKGPIIALTANALTGSAEMFRQNGFDDFISKPINIKKLNTVLNKFVRDRHLEMKNDKLGMKNEKAYLLYEGDKVAVNPKLLEVFRRDAEKAVVSLRDSLANGDIKLFTTTAHAMKSALANIGEKEKSEAAAALEKAGLDGDTEFIAANTGSFMKSLETLIKSTSPAEGGDTGVSDVSTEEDTAYLIEELHIIKSACEDYDDATAYAALDRLKEKPWRKETTIELEKIRDMLYLHSDFEGAATFLKIYQGEK